MSIEYVTIKKTDPLFLDYLWGRATYLKSRELRALPVKTYNLGTQEESVTFELQRIDQIKSPGFLLILTSLIKVNTFVLILFPAFYLLVKNYLEFKLGNPIAIVLAIISGLFLFAAINTRNDIVDHISGFDRVNIAFSKKAIRTGWISAHSASYLSWIMVAIAAIFAGPVVLLYPELFIIIVAAAILFVAGRLYKNNSYKDQHFGELILFLVSGPLLSMGFQISMGGSIDIEVVSFGILWGLIVIYLIQVNNFSHMMTSSLSGIKNTMTKFGFDISQKILIWWWIFLIGFCFLFLNHFSNIFWTLLGFVILLISSIPLYFKISNIKSPLGSGLVQIKRSARICIATMIAIVFCERISRLIALEWF